MQHYLIVYTGLSLLSIVLSVGSNALGQIAGARARRVLHERALRSVMRSPMRFFECTPVGRLINRFATDMSVVDKVTLEGKEFFTKLSYIFMYFSTENIHFNSEAGAIFIAMSVSHPCKCGGQPMVPHSSHSNLRCILLGAKVFQNFRQVNIFSILIT